jgi:hypothetical protein
LLLPVPGSRATTLRIVPARSSPSAEPSCAVASATCGLSPSAVNSPSRYARAAAWPCEPTGRGPSLMACTCFIARPAENSVGGAPAGTARGGACM